MKAKALTVIATGTFSCFLQMMPPIRTMTMRGRERGFWSLREPQELGQPQIFGDRALQKNQGDQLKESVIRIFRKKAEETLEGNTQRDVPGGPREGRARALPALRFFSSLPPGAFLPFKGLLELSSP